MDLDKLINYQQPDEVVQAAKKALESGLRSQSNDLAIAKALMLSNRLVEGKAYVDDAIKAGKENLRDYTEALILKAQAHILADQSSEAQKVLESILPRQIRSVDHAFKLAVLMEQSGISQTAHEVYAGICTGVERNNSVNKQTSSHAYSIAGHASMQLGNQQKAEKYYQDAILLDALNPEAHYGIANITEQSAKSSKAMHLAIAASVDYRFVPAYLEHLISIDKIDLAMDLFHGKYLGFGKKFALNHEFWQLYPALLSKMNEQNNWFTEALEAFEESYGLDTLESTRPGTVDVTSDSSAELEFRIRFVSYASDPKFQEAQESLVHKLALNKVIQSAVSWRGEDLIKTSFYRQFQSILNMPRGSGYWAWKPFIILQSLLDEGDEEYIFYHDCGWKKDEYVVAGSLAPIIDWANHNSNGCFIGVPMIGLKNGTWCKSDCLKICGEGNPEIVGLSQLSATWSIWKKCPEAIDFVLNWLRFSTDPRAITDYPNTLGGQNEPDFIDHRHDQAILTCLGYSGTRAGIRPFGGMGMEVEEEKSILEKSFNRKIIDEFNSLISNNL